MKAFLNFFKPEMVLETNWTKEELIKKLKLITDEDSKNKNPEKPYTGKIEEDKIILNEKNKIRFGLDKNSLVLRLEEANNTTRIKVRINYKYFQIMLLAILYISYMVNELYKILKYKEYIYFPVLLVSWLFTFIIIQYFFRKAVKSLSIRLKY
jgi:hypothetical protein